AADNIVRMMQKKPLKEFFWRDMGFLVSVGKGTALAEVFGIQFSGVIAWIIYRVAYLMKIVGTRAKLRTALEWTLNTFLPRDISKL
ncbi:MAG: NADH dehydrogenase, partial [Parcubacteria group bacterium Gr01-1014_70]